MGANQQNSLFHYLILLLEYTIREVQESSSSSINSSSSNTNNNNNTNNDNLLHSSTHFLTDQFIHFKMPREVSRRVTATACNWFNWLQV